VSRPPVRLLVLTALVLGACADAPRPAATVSGTDITDADVDRMAAVFTSVGAVQQVPCSGAELAPGDTEEAACNRFALSALIISRIAEDYAEEHGIEIEDDAVRDTARSFEANFGAELFADALAENGVTRADFLELVRLDLLQGEVVRAVATEELGDDAIQAAYEQRLAEFTVIDVDHVLVETQEEAQEVYDLATVPGATRADFLDLAEERSIDPSAADNSGALGPSQASGYVPEFAQAALALEVGETSEPVQSQFGWHVIRLNEKTETPLEDVRDQLVNEQALPLFATHVRQLDQAGEIDVNPKFGRFDADVLQVVRADSTDPSATLVPDVPATVAPSGG
jgi:PPIC-type PPIASE domain/SurA N-terminal domain